MRCQFQKENIEDILHCIYCLSSRQKKTSAHTAMNIRSKKHLELQQLWTVTHLMSTSSANIAKDKERANTVSKIFALLHFSASMAI